MANSLSCGHIIDDAMSAESELLESFELDPPEMREATLGYLVKQDKVLLAMKKRGFGQGKWNGVGGKLESGETPEDTMRREANEEVGIKPITMRSIGIINFYSVKRDDPLNQRVHLFLIESWDGEPAESEEMMPRWFDTNSIPMEEMWPDDKYWLPHALAGSKIQASFLFDEDDKNILEQNVWVTKPD